jgi:hypothetical protein
MCDAANPYKPRNKAALDAAIKAYGHYMNGDEGDRMLEMATKRIYSQVETWGDLLYTNLAFLTNRMWGTYYYPARFSSEDPAHAAASGNNLIELAKLGVFTVDGQDSGCDEQQHQRAYVYGYVPQAMEAALVARLREDPRIYFRVVNFITTNVEDTVPEEETLEYKNGRKGVFCLTRGMADNECFTDVRDLQSAIKFEAKSLKISAPSKTVHDLVHQSVKLNVIVRAWCEESADGILLEHVRAIQAPAT